MTPADIAQRLAEIASALEQHETAIWLLRDEQLRLRGQLRALNNQPSGPFANPSRDPAMVSS
jgi:hypothetical protein